MSKNGNRPENMYPQVTTGDVFRVYSNISKKYFIQIILSILGIFLAVSSAIIIPIYYKKFFDLLSLASTTPGVDITFLFKIIWVVLGLNIIHWLGYRIYWYFSNTITGRVMRDCVQFAFDYTIEHSHSFFINNFAGSLVQRINRFARSFDTLYMKITNDLLILILKVLGAGIVLYLVQPILALAIGIWMFSFLVVSFYFSKKKLKYDIEAAAMNSKITGMLSDSISNHNSIQLFSAANEESKRIEEVNTPFMNLNIFRWNFGNKIDAVQGLLGIAIEFFIFYYGIKYWNLGVISLGTFILAQAYILSIGNSLWGFSRIVRDIYQSVADAKEMVEILKLPHEIKDTPHSLPLISNKGEIEFKNVTFKFGKEENAKKVFDNLNINIKAGEKVAFIGTSGAGKSTLIKLLLRMHDIKEGEILIDGQNIQNVTQESLRNNISLVPQDPALFHRTLMENIRYGKRDATDESVKEAARLAHCDVFIKDFPYQYDTYVGERGVKLSGGERQRVAIARAILKNAPILVLDEATSSLDSHSESLIQDALHTLMKGKTTLVIAHRLSTIRKMDRIIVLGKEGVIEEGSHDELLKNDGVYGKLWKLQAGGFSQKSIEELLAV
jgi:ATP-binding cassette, subfamily B, bacterial